MFPNVRIIEKVNHGPFKSKLNVSHVLHMGQVRNRWRICWISSPMCYTWDRWLKHSPCVTHGKFWYFKYYSIGPHTFFGLVSAQSWSWQTAHARVGEVVWWTSTFIHFWLFKLSSTVCLCFELFTSFHWKNSYTQWSRGAYCVPEFFDKLANTYTQGHFWLFACLYQVCS